MNRFSFAVVAAFLLLYGKIEAQTLIKLPSNDFSCSVQVTNATEANANAPSPAASPPASPQAKGPPTIKSIEITQTGKLRRDLVTWSDGGTTEAWTLNDIGLTLVEKALGTDKQIIEFSQHSSLRNIFCPNLLGLDSTSLAWITGDKRYPAPAGIMDFKGKSTVHYQAKVSLPSQTPTPIVVTYQAWINPKTLMPIALDDGDNVYELTFADKPPQEPLVLPDRFKKDLRRYQNANATIRHL